MKTAVNEFHKANITVLKSGPERDERDFGGARGERTHQAGGRHRNACERGRNLGRKGETQLAHLRVHQVEQTPRAPCPKRQDDGVRWQCEVRSGM